VVKVLLLLLLRLIGHSQRLSVVIVVNDHSLVQYAFISLRIYSPVEMVTSKLYKVIRLQALIVKMWTF